jgi:hypothetical protein
MATNRNEYEVSKAKEAKPEASAADNGDAPGRRFCQCSLAIGE